MKYILFLVISFNCLLAYGQCTGSEFCNVCKNCTRCKHCKGGGYCGVCHPEKYKSKKEVDKKETVNNKEVNSKKEKKSVIKASKEDSILPYGKIDTKDKQIVNLDKKKSEEEIFTIVENMPEPKGGLGEYYKYISKNLKYPLYAKENGITGKVFLRLVINEDGTVGDISIVKGLSNCSECDEEALKVVRECLIKWLPGKMNNKAVKCYYTLPISFRL